MRDSYSDDASLFEHGIDTEFFLTFAGKLLARGGHRQVYECATDDTLVIKIEREDRVYANITEWDAWKCAQNTHLGDWLAPCVAISPRGIILLQKRTRPATRFPAKIPVQLGDTHKGNYGILGRRFVCHDYGSLQIMHEGIKSTRLHRVKWRD